jgi:ketosteroid isomerase-like protein
MSENLDFVRSIYADWERGDFSSTAWAHPEIEFVVADGPAPDVWRGLEGMREAWGDFLRSWSDWRGEAESYRELDSERVLVLIVGTGVGKVSGLDGARMSWRGANIFHVNDAAVTRLVVYMAREGALADLGLEE